MIDGSTPTQASLLRPWIRCFTTIIFAWWNLTSSKLKKSETKFQRKTRKQGQLLSESEFVLCIAPPSLSRDTRIKLKKSQSIRCARSIKGSLTIIIYYVMHKRLIGYISLYATVIKTSQQSDINRGLEVHTRKDGQLVQRAFINPVNTIHYHA